MEKRRGGVAASYRGYAPEQALLLPPSLGDWLPEGHLRYYRRRTAIVEPGFGWIMHALGFRRFSLRGEPQARGECRLVCTAVNLRRMHRLQPA